MSLVARPSSSNSNKHVSPNMNGFSDMSNLIFLGSALSAKPMPDPTSLGLR